ncbi:MAG: aminotransferase class V-fold PLP-dependent enzyme, partial [Holophagales bacterium]|nr:aminotransferase class V-fold PLP-dependent enzyme [Holophagales bacterium]
MRKVPWGGAPPPLDPALFEREPGLLWAMHAADGPIPRSSAEAGRAMLRRELRPWTLRLDADMRELPAEVRQEGARVLGCSAADLSLVSTTSAGLVTVARGLPLSAGDGVVLPAGESPGSAWPWLALAAEGSRVRQVPLWDGHLAGAGAWDSAPPPPGVDPESRLLGALEPETAVLAVSWVRFQDGLVLDLRRLAEGCRRRGVRLVVDGIQGAGLLLPELAGVSAFVAGGHKGLLGVQGSGLLWTSPETRREMGAMGSWLSVEQGLDFSRPSTDLDRARLDDGRRLEQGVPNLVGLAILHRSLALLAEVGVAAIDAHVAELRCHLIEGLGESRQWRAEGERLAALAARGRLG